MLQPGEEPDMEARAGRVWSAYEVRMEGGTGRSSYGRGASSIDMYSSIYSSTYIPLTDKGASPQNIPPPPNIPLTFVLVL